MEEKKSLEESDIIRGIQIWEKRKVELSDNNLIKKIGSISLSIYGNGEMIWL